MSKNGPKIPEGQKNRERFPSVGTLGTSPAQPSDGLRNGPTRSEVVIFGVAGVRLGWVGTRYFILVPRPPQMAQSACKMRPRAKCTFCLHSAGRPCTVAADQSWLEATLAREAIWQGKWRYSGGVGGRPEPESCILYPPTLTEPLRLRI